MPYNEFLKTLSEDDFKKKIISRTLCTEPNRANCAKLLSIVRQELVLRLPKRAGETNPLIFGMSYNSARDELFLADRYNGVVRSVRVRDNAGYLRDVYRAPHLGEWVWSVCHMNDSDTLLVCEGYLIQDTNWLVALSRNGSEWREAHRVQTDAVGMISCALSDSRVLIGCGYLMYKYMELFRVESSLESGPRIARVHRIHVPELYCSFSATCGSDTLVAICYPFVLSDHSVRVHRLRGDRLEELARIQLKYPREILWLADRLLVADFYFRWNGWGGWNAVIELEVSNTRLERRRELIAASENIYVISLCAVNDGVAIFDYNTRDILHYSFA